MALLEQQIQIGQLDWFYREAKPLRESADRLPVVFLHGLVSQSYSWRDVMPKVAEQGFRAIAPDWISHGFSSFPEKRDFAYTADAFVTALGDFLAALEIERMHLVVQGFLGVYGLLYALRHPEQIERLVIINVPLAPVVKLPWSIRRMTLPLAGEMMTQDPLLVDRTLEGGGPYQVSDTDLDVYRKPFLTTSSAGRSLLFTLRSFRLDAVTQEIESSLKQWQGLTRLIWGTSDPWIPTELAETWVNALPNGELSKLDEVGHYAQEDWADKVSEVLVPFLKQTNIS
ncbi:alpha/beta fold hydrolase [Oscillatoria sp. CS-180]|uniref:alpha/beta fold hydrolase n=1 Tax=Oscillatoria sp. CS-180 TaxID=3021720 RepID=UPI00232FEC19|nr:alpha/beta fold hydrolase [Oscillatoria sp. CS-180]MDB9526594.1 alpha/beta fold hydrolase [Oscillatoria sp. CS-180]